MDEAGGVRVAAEAKAGGALWLLGGDWTLRYWDGGDVPDQARRAEQHLWEPSETPTLLNDCARIGPVPERPEAWLLATDTGAYLLPLREGTSVRRIALPAVGYLAMSVTYVERGPYRLLWVTDFDGDSHLFWDVRGLCLEQSNFRRTGLVHLGSQAIRAVAWAEGADSSGSTMLAQMCRDDRIRLMRFGEKPEPDASSEKAAKCQRLLVDGTCQEIRTDWLADLAGQELVLWSSAPPDAVLASWLEHLAAGQQTRKALGEFLASPSSGLFESTLEYLPEWGRAQGVLDSRQHTSRAIRTWALCLVGLANRLETPRVGLHLGVMRLLLQLRHWAERQPHALGGSYLESVQAEIGHALLMARRWGLYGSSNAIRLDLVLPVRVLEAADKNRPKLTPGSLDYLTYRALLFRRGVSLRTNSLDPPRRGRRAWDLSTLAMQETDSLLAAVSWSTGEVDVYEVNGLGTDDPSMAHRGGLIKPRPKQNGLAAPRWRRPLEPLEEGSATLYGHSRATLLGTSENGQPYLLTAFTREDTTRSWIEELELWPIAPSGVGCDSPKAPTIATIGQPAAAKTQDAWSEESVYRLLQIAPGCVLAGLRGNGGVPRLALLRVRDGESPSSAPSLEIEFAFELLPQAKEEEGRVGQRDQKAARNRVWSLAITPHREPTHSHVAIGCEDGRIWRVQVSDLLKAGFRSVPCTEVGRLSSPVTALLMHPLSDGRERQRITAGGRDGSLVCFEELPGGTGGFAPLWATWERGQISGLGYFEVDDPGPLVLGLTQEGRAVLVDDRASIEAAETRTPTSERRRFPGNRRGRTSFDDSVFAASAIPLRPSGKSSLGIYGFALTASGEGTLRLLSLHYPLKSAARADEHKLLLELFQAHVQARQAEAADLSLMRTADLVYQASHILGLIPVRWLLDELPSRMPAPFDWKPWWLPSYLQPLLRLRIAWDSRDSQIVQRELAESLDQAWLLKDLALFNEIAGLALKKANTTLRQQINETGDATSVQSEANLYGAVFTAIEQGLQRWLGADDRKEARARINVAKNLLDGPTLFDLLAGVAKEQGTHSTLPRLLDSPSTALTRVYLRQIEGIRQLVFKRDPLVSVETLRTLNHCLLRVASVLARPSSLQAHPPRAVPWPVFEPLFDQLVWGAVSLFGTRAELTDAHEHEWARTFALCLHVCPSATLRMANRLREARLIKDPLDREDLTQRIDRQVVLLDGLGLALDPLYRALFRLVTRRWSRFGQTLQERWGDILDEFNQSGARGLPRDLEEIQAGPENETELLSLRKLERYLSSFVDLGRRLSGDGRNIDLTEAKLASLLVEVEPEEPYRHSLDFWVTSVRTLLRQGRERHRHPRGVSNEHLRPETVLFLRELDPWADERIRDLDQRYEDGRLFEPEHSMFRETLDYLQRATRAFPGSAALQRNLVVGVFGHHLLQDLDEHVFELDEIARNLSPTSAEDPRSTEAFFARFLHRRAEEAQSIPRNLRALYGLFDSPGVDDGDREGQLSSKYPLDSFLPTEWRPAASDGWAGVRLTNQSYRILGMILEELKQNQEKHAATSSELMKQIGVPECRLSVSPRTRRAEVRVTVEFMDSHSQAAWLLERRKGQSRTGSESRWPHHARLRMLASKGIQRPMGGREASGIASSGMGLYLANLAAATIGWELRVGKPIEVGPLSAEPAAKPRFRCSFVLSGPVEETRGRGTNLGSSSQDPAPPERPKENGNAKAEVIVVDDNPRFPLFVYRYLADELGFDLKASELTERDARLGELPSGEASVHWVNTRESDAWTGRLAQVEKGTRGQDRVFLLDVLANRDSGGGGGRVVIYEALASLVPRKADARGGLADLDPSQHWIVSSYHQGYYGTEDRKPLPVRPKNPSTMEELKKRLGLTESQDKAPQGAHVLVTGAGFEFRNETRATGTGVRWTRDLVRATLEGVSEFEGESGSAIDWNALRDRVATALGCSPDVLGDLQDSSDLDRYWDELLEAVLGYRDPRDDGTRVSTRDRWLKANGSELKLREAFRRQFLNCDWGHLRQAVDAAGLEWKAWLTTNYTRFAERAITLADQSERKAEERLKPWRVVSIPSEARRLEHQMMHDRSYVQSGQHRLLFKLHGDVAHVDTMAIAGQDKELLSSLSLRIDSLHQVYVSARDYLSQMIEAQPGQAMTMTWHLVGHALGDRLLLDSIFRVASAGKARHRFVIVNPDEDPGRAVNRKRPHRALLEFNASQVPRLRNLKGRTVRTWLTAEQYMARLRRFGLGALEDELEAVLSGGPPGRFGLHRLPDSVVQSAGAGTPSSPRRRSNRKSAGESEF